MSSIKSIKYFLICCSLALGMNMQLIAQSEDVAKPESEAEIYFQNNEFRNALNAYLELSRLFPQNAGYQYYIGRCLLELEEKPDETIDFLRFAAVKGSYSNAWFYLGEAYFQKSNYEKAKNSYKRFITEGKKKEIKKLAVKEKLAKAEKEMKGAAEQNKNAGEKLHGDNPENQSIKDIPVKHENENVYIQTQTENRLQADRENMNREPELTSVSISSASLLTKSALAEDENLSKALNLQLEADSMQRLARIKRAELKETSVNDQRNMLISEITLLEKKSQSSQAEADSYYKQIQVNTVNNQNEITVPKADSVIELKDEINGIKVYRYKTGNIGAAKQQSGDNIQETENKKAVNLPGTDIINEFSMNAGSVNREVNPVAARKQMPQKLIYYIQLGVYSKKLNDNEFASITPVCFDELISKGMFKYYAGRFSSVHYASDALKKLKLQGFPDAFIVAFYNDEQVSLDRAGQIEASQLK